MVEPHRLTSAKTRLELSIYSVRKLQDVRWLLCNIVMMQLAISLLSWSALKSVESESRRPTKWAHEKWEKNHLLSFFPSQSKTGFEPLTFTCVMRMRGRIVAGVDAMTWRKERHFWELKATYVTRQISSYIEDASWILQNCKMQVIFHTVYNEYNHPISWY